MQMPVGTRLQGGKYEIVRFISSGGFGCTYEAKHAMLNKSVAIKEFFVKDFCNRYSTTNKPEGCLLHNIVYNHTT